MKIILVTANNNLTILSEGGNVVIGDAEANRIDATKRAEVVPIIQAALAAINSSFQKFNKGTPLWNPKTLASGLFLSGSSFHFFNRAQINDLDFAKVKKTVGDIDTQVDREQKEAVGAWLSKLRPGTKFGPSQFIGFKLSAEQYITLWRFPGIALQTDSGKQVPTNVQIDLELKAFQAGTPTEWSRFSASSAWEDLQAGIKGVFHKFILQSLASLTEQDFLLRKLVGRGKARAEQDVPMTDNMISFSVQSKEGGGLRIKYEPVIDTTTKKPLVKDGMKVYTARPTTGYEQDLSKIFATLFGERLSNKQLASVAPKFWSFLGVLSVINQYLSPEEKQKVADSFIDKTFGPAAQGLYVNDPETDAREKMIAVDAMLKALKIKAPKNFQKMVADYKANYRMKVTEGLKEAETAKPNYKRQGIKHIYNPGSSTEMRDSDFIMMCDEITANKGTLTGIPINLKVDGAGIRFGRDQKGEPFMMTSRVTSPLYAKDIGSFEKYGREQGQSQEQLDRTKNYDKALSLIVNSKFIKTLPKDCIVQAEMLFNDMAEKTKDGYKFVNISYDPKKLGKEMTLVPFMFKKYSTGESLPDADKIKHKLLSQGDKSIKFVDNELKHAAIDVKKIIAPVVNMEPAVKDALLRRGGMTPEKQKAREILNKLRKSLSDAIIKNPKIKGKDQLGKNIEGLVINMPSGLLAKVTSTLMQHKMAAKKAAAAPVQRQVVTPAVRHTPRTAVVAIGNFAGHRGHEQLINYAIEKAKAVKGTPFVFVGHKVGKEDPIDIHTKLETLRKLYPGVTISEVQNQIDPATGAETVGNIFKKIEYELVKKQPHYNNIIITVGADQTGVAKVAKSMQDRFGRFAPLSHVKVSAYITPRSAEQGGTGVSTTQLRQALANPNLTAKQKLGIWSQAYNVEKLGEPWIKHLMDVARKNMNLAKIDDKINEIEGDSMSPITGDRDYVRPISKNYANTSKLISNDLPEHVTIVDGIVYDDVVLETMLEVEKLQIKSNHLKESPEELSTVRDFFSNYKSETPTVGEYYFAASVTAVVMGKLLVFKYLNKPAEFLEKRNNLIYLKREDGSITSFPGEEIANSEMIFWGFLFKSLADLEHFKTLLMLKFSDWKIKTSVKEPFRLSETNRKRVRPASEKLLARLRDLEQRKKSKQPLPAPVIPAEPKKVP
jgi:hypothetical protein